MQVNKNNNKHITMKEIDIKSLNENMIEAIGKEWMLITAGKPEKFNTMTASWGGVGFLWNKPVAFVFVRPERFTFGFTEAEPCMTLSFLGSENQKIATFCGTHSGKNCDKVAETGLRPITTPNGQVTFEQARLTLECRKLYEDDLKASCFIDKACLERWYNDQPGGSLHKVYVVEIEHVYVDDARV